MKLAPGTAALIEEAKRYADRASHTNPARDLVDRLVAALEQAVKVERWEYGVKRGVAQEVSPVPNLSLAIAMTADHAEISRRRPASEWEPMLDA